MLPCTPQMDVVYEGPLQLSEGQVETLLGYQNPINKLVNWNITRTQVCTGGVGSASVLVSV